MTVCKETKTTEHNLELEIESLIKYLSLCFLFYLRKTEVMNIANDH